MALFFLWIAATVAVVIGWFAILLTGRYPRPLFDFVQGVSGWNYRVVAYAVILTTDHYPRSGWQPRQCLRRTRLRRHRTRTPLTVAARTLAPGGGRLLPWRTCQSVRRRGRGVTWKRGGEAGGSYQGGQPR